MKSSGNIRKPFRLAGNLLLLFIALTTGWILLSAREAYDNFGQMRPLIKKIQDACNKQNRCPTSQEFEAMVMQASIDSSRLRYIPGEHAVPGKETAFELVHGGEQYFRILFIPTMEVGYHASGGKDIELVMWKSLDGDNTRIR